MDAARAAQALAQATSSMTGSLDVAGAMSALLVSCHDALGVDASGVLLESRGRLELFVASSHQADELETHQLHADEGPCIEAYRTGLPVRASSAGALVERWPDFGVTMLASGFASVHASPLGIRGSTFGAMGLFRRADVPFEPDEDRLAQAFADIASVLVAHLGEVTPQHLAERAHQALDGRIVIEQAKGVLADTHDLTMAAAYDLLVAGALEQRQPLTAWAAQVVAAAHEGR